MLQNAAGSAAEAVPAAELSQTTPTTTTSTTVPTAATFGGAATIPHCSEEEEHEPSLGGSPGSVPDGETALVDNDRDETTTAALSGKEELLVNGGSQPHSPQTQGTTAPLTWFQKKGSNGVPLVYKVELNVVWWVLLLLGTVVRVWRLDYPRYVV